MISHDDPRWTAYALGELDGAECADDRAAVEAALAEDPAAKVLVEEIRADGAMVAEAMRSEPQVALTLQQRGALLAAAAALPPPGGRLIVGAPWRRWVPLGLVGAAAAALVAVSLMQAGGGGREPDGTVVARGDGGGPAVNDSGDMPLEGLALDAGSVAPPPGAASAGAPTGAPRASGRVSSAPTSPTLAGRAQGYVLKLRDGAVAGVPVPPATLPPTSYSVLLAGVPPAAPTPTPALSALAAGVPPVGPAVPRDVALRALEAEAKLRGAAATAPASEGSAGESYDTVVESPFQRVADAPLSTFSIDVDTASYANVRRMLNAGQRPPAAAVRLEEMLNYFPYADPAPKGDDPFAVKTEVAACPWNLKHRLVRIGVHGREIERKARPASNLVFLIDVSGSMDQPDKLPLVQASMRMLLEELNERDTVSIVVYAGASGLVLPPTSCEQKAVIQRAIDAMKAGGSTNGAAGLELAYQTAQQAFLTGGVNRVVLATDGDWNVGVTSQGGLLGLIQEKAKSGIFLTCLGYGMGNLKDSTLEMLADKGNGNYGYIDSTREARKVLVEGASGTLVTIAKDVKIQVEFNPAKVASYRLVGYDNRLLAARDFNDDTKDAGEIGAGHTVTALYELVPVGVEDVPPAKPATPEVDPLKYQGTGAPPPTAPVAAPAPAPTVPAAVAGEMLTVKLRFKQPDGQTSVKREYGLTDEGGPYEKASPDFKFASSVAAFALILKGSPYAGTASLETVLELASEGLSFDPGGYRKEFLDLVAKAIGMHLGK